MAHVRMYCTAFCPYCVRAEMFRRNQKGVDDLDKISLDYEPHGFTDLVPS